MTETYTCILCYVIIKCVYRERMFKMKIIKAGTVGNPFPKFQVKCKYCESEFEIEGWDDVYIKDISPFLNKFECGCDCPVCGTGVNIPDNENAFLFEYILKKPRTESKRYIDTAWRYINALGVNKKQLLHVGIINQMPLPEKLYRKQFKKEGSWSK